MNALQVRIQGLNDDQAIALLKRLLRAISTGASTTPFDVTKAESIARSLSITSEPIAVPTPGELARSALVLLAGDDKFEGAIAALMSQSDGVRSFSSGAQTLNPVDILNVVEMRLPVPANAAAAQARSAADSESHSLLRALTRQLVDYAGFGQAGPQSDAEYRVWYATSRKPLDPGDPSKGFGTERDEQLHYGSCQVFIPRSHKVGSIGSSWWKRVVTFSDDRMKLLAVDTLEVEAFWAGVSGHLAQCAEEDRDAVVFIHGFNVDFQEAALRAAQIGFDLQVRGAMAFFSWASRGEVAMYPADEAAVELDEDAIANYLCDFALRTGARKVHVIAHSMGNRVVARAISKIAQEAQQRSGVRFGQIVLAAADIDARKFVQLSPAYPKLAERTTMYVSSRDAAVEASRWLHDFPRAGLMPPVTIAPGIDTINAVNTDLTLLGHGYVAQAREVVCDIHALIKNGDPPDRRFGLRSVLTEKGEPYWLIGA